MGKVLYRRANYIIVEDLKSPGNYVVVNTRGQRVKGKNINHGHIKRYKTCKNLIGWMIKGVVPKSPYLREAALRISLDRKYHNKILHKIEKDRQKPKYVNINKGVRK